FRCAGKEGWRAWLVLPERIELSTSPLPRECSTTELRQRDAGGDAAPGRGASTAIEGLAAQPRLQPVRLCVSVAAMATHRTPETLAEEAERKRRLAEALRENLRRRKAQARGRRTEGGPAREPREPREG